MTTVFDVKPNDLLKVAAVKLREIGLPEPAYVKLVKTGPQADRAPSQPDFWYIRCASLLRQVYVNEGQGVGVARLRTHYGGRQNNGSASEHHRDSGGSIIRRGFQALEKLGLVEHKKTGRIITAKGKKLLDSAAQEAAKGKAA
ncbi:30S ribosomal protein S19e [Candidatus Gugararchaeum adminiculabundum]|nr:30S ribosomal protein S19e [Candidatus Gugararchaeum adminiculabundum]